MSAAAPDRRLNAYRADLAASDLKGLVDAPRYVDGRLEQVTVCAVALRPAPGEDQPINTHGLFGEKVRVFDEHEGWAWAQLMTDRYVGYLPAAALGAVSGEATHLVSVLRTHLYLSANIKAPPMAALPMNAQVSVADIDAGFARLAGGGVVFAAHLRPITEPEVDFVAVAERFLGTPYLWGGKTSLGIDCSALVQLSLNAAGLVCPRDSDMQEVGLGTAGNLRELARGDLVFWPGHVGIMADSETLVHANVHHMMVAREPFAEATARIKASGNEVTSIRRLAALSAKTQ